MWGKELLLGALVGLATVSPAQAAPQPLIHRDFVVVIDPGHGGTNDGCLSHDGSTLEKQLTLRLAHDLEEQLQGLMPHAEVLLTHEADVTMTLADRVAFANAAGADLFLSIHANASPARDQTGHETYLLDLDASSLEAARTAQRENDEGFVRPEGANEVDVMLRQLTMTSNRAKAARFAHLLQDEYQERFPDRHDRGVRQAPFDVLMGVRMPAVLTEVGFLDHPEEGAMLLSPASQAELVDGMAEAVLGYYRSVERRQ
jgi:N-acetylmuramoyl-L-alanine amidase